MILSGTLHPDLPQTPQAQMGGPGPGPAVIAILGGGLSGAALAYHLARQSRPEDLRILVIEPRPALGQGLAYATTDPQHRLNVPDRRMSLSTETPEDFRRWQAEPGAPLLPAGAALASGDVFAPRWVFGRYVADRLAPFLALGQVVHLRARAVAARRAPQTGEGTGKGGGEGGGTGFVITLDDGQNIQADRLVLATGHPPPALPAELAGLPADHPALIADSNQPGALEAIGQTERVLVLGSGLTGADILATLEARGHHAPLVLLSRHGRRSQPHGPAQGETQADLAANPPRSARALLVRIRQALAEDAAQGLTWHALFDRLRAQGPQIWAALPLVERRRLLRHLRGLWDVHRFRIAPQTHAALERLLQRRQLTALAGRITALAPSPDGRLAIEIALRGGRAVTRYQIDRLVLATGPGHRGMIAGNPVLADLAGHGLICADPLRLGLATDTAGAALAANGQAQPDLLVAGPPARAAIGELMGVPEVTAWTERLAQRLLAELPQGQDQGAGQAQHFHHTD